MDLKNKTKLFFDLDGTLTPSRQAIKEPLAEILPKLNRTIIVVSGSKNEQIRKQLFDFEYFSLGQNGNQALDQKRNFLWENILTDEERSEIRNHIEILRPKLQHHIPDANDLIEDRGSQISFSIYGHNALPAEKKACDGDFAKRKRLLTEFPFISTGVEVQMGGSTCLDYFRAGCHKGSNVEKLIDLMKWKTEECVYFGDALFKGGNDETVTGIIDTVAVKNEDDTYAKLLPLL